MADKTKIEWPDATVNAINGCSVISSGCTDYYAMRSGVHNLTSYPSTELTKPSKADYVWTGEVRLSETALLQPLKWKKPRRILWNAHGDMFHKNVPDDWIDRCFAVMALTPQHAHMVLTKRPERMLDYVKSRKNRKSHKSDLNFSPIISATALDSAVWIPRALYRSVEQNFQITWPLPNAILGVSAEDQEWVDKRIPILLATPAAKRFLSLEPLLGSIDLSAYLSAIDLVIVGGESGHGSRPMHPDWVRSIRDQCAAAGVPFMFKQWGDYRIAQDAGIIPGLPVTKMIGPLAEGDYFCKVGKKRSGRTLDGVLHDGAARAGVGWSKPQTQLTCPHQTTPGPCSVCGDMG